jgi:hypothetical protein
MNRLMLPCAQVCQRASAKASTASAAIKAATAGRFVLDASERDGGGPVPASEPMLVAAGAAAGRANSGPSGMADSATRARAARCS